MQVCPNCQHRNRPGLLFCDSCGASLIGDSPLSTKNLAAKSPTGELDAADVLDALGSDVFRQGTVLRIEVEGAEPILLKPKEETVFGRRDPATGNMPDVDMTPFAGYRMGVSRKHAIIKQNADNDRLELFDLGSSNGTFLNGTRMTASKPYKLRDGDEIRLGQMAVKVYFQQAVQPSTSAPTVPTPTPPIPPAPPVLPESDVPDANAGTQPAPPPSSEDANTNASAPPAPPVPPQPPQVTQ
jgi:pSer/pThr/pTyr-binding forkhead associated (FHA) protein